jgi:hypothetical protein
MVMVAMQKYGGVVADRGGSIAMRFENPKRFTQVGVTNPWTALFNGTPTYEAMRDIPWSETQWLPHNYGRP